MKKIRDITDQLERWASPDLQETYDNSGLLLGDQEDSCESALISLDVTEEVVDEAIAGRHQLIIAHHPLIFKGIKRLGKRHWVDRCIRKAIANDIAIYAIHTNLDNVHTGVNRKIAAMLDLQEPQILMPRESTLCKLTVFLPKAQVKEVTAALFDAGAGNIGNYDHCSFQAEGHGTFRGNEHSHPTIGTAGTDERVPETRVEVLVRKHSLGQVLAAMKKAHPYEEVAYYTSDLLNENQEVGAGMIGTLAEPVPTKDFLRFIKDRLHLQVIRHTALVKDQISRVALCGGSGSFLLGKAISRKADIFISADFKYHDFFEANGQIIIADVGHFESEAFTKELLHNELSKTFANFAFRLSKVDTNPIKYLHN